MKNGTIMNKINLIIPAAGEATRLKPLSNNTSKIMVRVNGKPCLDYIIEQANKLGDVQEIVIVDGKFDDVREYCSLKHPEVTFIKQENLNGPRPAIALGFTKIENDLPTVVWLGDAIILEDNLPLGEDFLLCKQVDNHSSWCMWDGSDYYNKPDQTVNDSVALVGLYSFSDGEQAKYSFQSVNSYDISDALENYTDKHIKRFQRVLTNEWYDIGTLSVYHETCGKLLRLKSRAFNNISFNDELGTVTKSPDYHDKHSVDTLNSERLWYKNITAEQSLLVPRVIPHENDLIMSYESGSLLSDLMLYENLSESNWSFIIDKLFRIKLKYFSEPLNRVLEDDFSTLAKSIWIDKTEERLDQTTFDKKERETLNEIAIKIHRNTTPVQTHHGDLHFGNVLYNHYTNQFKLIDPRGNYGGVNSTLGDNYYDWCKLAHDLYHGYSAIVANVKQNKIVKKVFIEKLKEYKLPINDIVDGGLLLLATCIPLHYDDSDRQKRISKYVSKTLKQNK